jgi:integrase
MARLEKAVTTHWTLNGKRVPAGTPGAVKSRVESSKWYVVYRHNGKVVKKPAYTDKAASQKVLSDTITALERGEAGLTDPYRHHLDKPIGEHVAAYLEDVRHNGTSADYQDAVGRRLWRVLRGIGAMTLRDVTADKVKKFLRTMTDARKSGEDAPPVAVTTKNDHRSALSTFFEWAILNDLAPVNPVDKVPTIKPPKGEPRVKRRRRALRPAELRRVIRAAEAFPLQARLNGKGGRPRKDGTKAPCKPANLTSETVAALCFQGRERRLWYILSIFTGLRRGELSRVKVRHFKQARGWLDLPGEILKNGRPAIIPLVPRLADELREWVKDKAAGEPLVDILCRQNLRRVHRQNLKAAGLPYQTDDGFSDWHSHRKTTNTYLRRRGVSLRLRQRFLRHAAGDLATGTYDDERVQELRPVVAQLERLWRYCTAPENG